MYFNDNSKKTEESSLKEEIAEVIKIVYIKSEPEVREVLKHIEVPVEIIKEIQVEVEKIKEVQVVKEIEVIVEKLVSTPCELKHCNCVSLTNIDIKPEQKDNKFKYLLPLLYALAGALLTKLL